MREFAFGLVTIKLFAIKQVSMIHIFLCFKFTNLNIDQTIFLTLWVCLDIVQIVIGCEAHVLLLVVVSLVCVSSLMLLNESSLFGKTSIY
jgi:hypothetical protein